jgi:hypothetical protein
MKRPGERRRPSGGHAERRRSQFEESHGQAGRRALPLDEEPTGDEQGIPQPPLEGEEPVVDEKTESARENEASGEGAQ